jgi:hypothetical protein
MSHMETLSQGDFWNRMFTRDDGSFWLDNERAIFSQQKMPYIKLVNPQGTHAVMITFKDQNAFVLDEPETLIARLMAILDGNAHITVSQMSRLMQKINRYFPIAFAYHYENTPHGTINPKTGIKLL